MAEHKKTERKRKTAALKKIEIIPGDPPTVDQTAVTVSKKNQDQVRWWSRSKDWAVVFNCATPFESHYFSPCHPGNMRIVGDYGTFKYSIFVDGNSADPVIIVGDP